MKNNKLFGLFIAVLVCLTLVVSVSAANDNRFTFTLASNASVDILDGTPVAKAGDTIVVKLYLDENTGFSSVYGYIEYDKTKLELTDITNQTNLETNKFAVKDNRITLGNALDAFNSTSELINYTGVVAEVTFKVLEDVTDCVTEIGFRTSSKYVMVHDTIFNNENLTLTSNSLSLNLVGSEHKHSEYDVIYDEESAKDATCFEEGKKADEYCAHCGQLLAEGAVIEKNEHTWDEGNVITGVGCTTDGKTLYTCTVEGCGATKEVVVPAIGHDMVTVEAADPTCEADGNNKYYICNNCDKVFKDMEGKTETTVEAETISKIGHDYKLYKTFTEPGCETEGYGLYICNNCGGQKQDIIEALGGHIEVIDAAEEATCSKTGLTEGRHCSVCGEILKKQEIIEKKPHDYVVTSIIEATCSAEGEILKKCSVCGDFTSKNTEKLAHVEEEIAAVEATCTENGLTAGKKCSICGEILEEQEVVAKLAHTYVEENRTEATCTENGMIFKACACGAFTTEKIEAKGHIEEEIAAVEATCTENGLTAGKKCSICGEILEEQEVVAKLGHKFENYVSDNNATCTANGTETAKCENCEETDTREIENSKIAHDMAEFSVIEAQCEKVGYITYKCNNCNYAEVQEVEALGGHSWDGGVIETLPTCGKDGVRVFTCIICGETKTDTNVPATGAHVYGEWKVTTEATTDAEGVETRYCMYCDATEIRSIDMLPKDYTVVIVISIVVVVLAGAGVAAYFVLKNKKK